jgi:hypothetical protein
MGGACNAYKILARKSEGKRPLDGTRRRCEKILECVLEKLAGKAWIAHI